MDTLATVCGPYACRSTNYEPGMMLDIKPCDFIHPSEAGWATGFLCTCKTRRKPLRCGGI